MKQLNISPVTRIEGHAQVRIELNDAGEVEHAHFNVVELRGFEKFLIGSAVEEAPRITPRICGICPTAHHLASVKACDQIFGVQPTQTADRLRELLLHGQFIHSHSLHYFMLAAPDFLIGHDAPPNERSVIGLVKKAPDIAKKAIEVRKFGQRLTEAIGGKPIHPNSGIPGGISHPLEEESRVKLLGMAETSLGIAQECWDIARTILDRTDKSLGEVTTSFMGMSNGGRYSIYDGTTEIVGSDGNPVTSFSGTDYINIIEEYSEDWSYLKFSRLKNGDYYRVGPLARLNIIKNMGTEVADSALQEYREKFGNFVQTTLVYNIARYIEFIASCERAIEILSDPAITSLEIRNPVERVQNNRGVGILEAPRGTLIHDYAVDDEGFIEKCNLIVATCQNNYAMDRGVEDVARKVIKNGELTENASNQIEMVIRAYDPCISCATHAIGSMNLNIQLVRKEKV